MLLVRECLGAACYSFDFMLSSLLLLRGVSRQHLVFAEPPCRHDAAQFCNQLLLVRCH